MKKLIAACAAFAVVALVSPVSAAAASAWNQETEHVSRTVKLEPGGRLRLKSFSGRVNITASDGNEVVIDATRRATRDRLDHIKLDVYSSGSTVTIDANRRDSSWWTMRDNVVETDFDIKVPRRIDLDVTVFSAPVTVSGVEGESKVHGFSSRITLNDVNGGVEAHTFSGAIDISVKNWNTSQRVDTDTFSGNVSLRVPTNAAGTVAFNSFSGHLDSDIPLTFHSSSRKSLRAELGNGGGGALRFKSFSGSVRIDK
jgi:hypothetical protein